MALPYNAGASGTFNGSVVVQSSPITITAANVTNNDAISAVLTSIPQTDVGNNHGDYSVTLTVTNLTGSASQFTNGGPSSFTFTNGTGGTPTGGNFTFGSSNVISAGTIQITITFAFGSAVATGDKFQFASSSTSNSVLVTFQ
jgi:hypothetical protein